jgi:glutathione S-transferase
MGRTLVHLPQSPWSEKARWALDHHGVEYKLVEHVPMVFEPVLRIWSRDLRRKITVPILFDESHTFSDSLAIAERAEEVGRGSPLFPRSHLAEIVGWNEVAERIMWAGRARAMERMLQNKQSLVEQLPPFLRPGGRALLPLAKAGAAFVRSKHVPRTTSPAELEAAMTAGLDKARAALATSAYLTGGAFTFADVAIACALGFVVPPARLPLGPATRDVFSDPKLASVYADLVAWRDRLIEHHR